MDNNITIILELLSAGVIAALVAGIFSLAIAIKNNKRLVDLENIKQKFTINQERYKALKEAYDELLAKLPEKNLLNHIIINLPAQNEFQKKIFLKYIMQQRKTWKSCIHIFKSTVIYFQIMSSKKSTI